MGCIYSIPINITPHQKIKHLQHLENTKYMHTINISPSFPGQYSPRPSQKIYNTYSLSNIT